MGFEHWHEGAILVLVFSVIMAIPCVAVAMIGTRMINELGNFPSKASQIQSNACWKVLVLEIVSFILLALFFHFFS